MKKILATNDKNAYAIVDDDIAEIIQEMKLKFCINNKGYFQLTKRIQLPCMTKKKCLQLHRFIWLLKTGEEHSSEIDHKDRNKSNNMFENLRLATRKQQNRHRGKMKNNTSGLIGVSHSHKNMKYKDKTYENDYWQADIQRSDGHHEAKTFPFTPAGKIAAGKYYDTKSIEYFGEFHGQLNFPNDN